jgi:hypothetical protein
VTLEELMLNESRKIVALLMTVADTVALISAAAEARQMSKRKANIILAGRTVVVRLSERM